MSGITEKQYQNTMCPSWKADPSADSKSTVVSSISLLYMLKHLRSERVVYHYCHLSIIYDNILFHSRITKVSKIIIIRVNLPYKDVTTNEIIDISEMILLLIIMS
jgi:hypothetical protein